jgi:hypothetical protein
MRLKYSIARQAWMGRDQEYANVNCPSDLVALSVIGCYLRHEWYPDFHNDSSKKGKGSDCEFCVFRC